jgi:glucan phosphorylase
MKFSIDKSQENIYNLMRVIGYCPAPAKAELSFIRRIGIGDYPRFHIYLKADKSSNKIIFNLHLDQKKPVYQGARAHSAEYEGRVVEQEVERIRTCLASLGRTLLR